MMIVLLRENSIYPESFGRKSSYLKEGQKRAKGPRQDSDIEKHALVGCLDGPFSRSRKKVRYLHRFFSNAREKLR